MPEEVFYSKGRLTYDKQLIEKIKKDAEPCWWHQDSFDRDLPDKTDGFTGWIDEKGVVRDICGILYRRENRRQAEISKKRHEMFLEMEARVLYSTKEVETFSNNLDRLADLRAKISKTETKLRNKYVQMDGVVRGSKKKRRFKKNNKRDLTEKELEFLEKEKNSLKLQEEQMSQQLNIEEVLYGVFRRIYGITKQKISAWHQKYGYHRTEGIYKIYELRLSSLKDQINRLAYNDIVQENEETEVTLKDVNEYDEIFERVMDKIEDDIEYDNSIAHQQRRTVTRKARFYINERGERVELGQDVNQVVLHNN